LVHEYAGLDKTAEVQRKMLKDSEDDSELTLKCHVEGNPEPNIIWTRNKQRCDTNRRVTTAQSETFVSLSVFISHILNPSTFYPPAGRCLQQRFIHDPSHLYYYYYYCYCRYYTPFNGFFAKTT